MRSNRKVLSAADIDGTECAPGVCVWVWGYMCVCQWYNVPMTEEGM